MRGVRMRSLPQELYTAEQVRQLDRYMIDGVAGHPGMDSFALMQRAASAAWTEILQRWPALYEGSHLQVFCGAGNNGGDGYLIAALAADQYIPVSVVSLKDPDSLQGDALKAFQHCQSRNVSIEAWSEKPAVDGDILVDSLLGTGLSGPVRDDFQDVIHRINQSGKPVVAIDIPSGLCSDTGSVLGIAVKAELTVTFIGMKQGLLTGRGPAFVGELRYASLDVPDVVFQQMSPASYRLSHRKLSGLIQPRWRDAHKGDNGHVLVIGGNHGMPGAVIMAAEAAMHCGAGKVSVATRPEHLTALAIRRPEVMAFSVSGKAALMPLLSDKSVIVVGPGLGATPWGFELLEQALSSELPVVLDADALNLLSEHPRLRRARKSPVILTPHPGEAARLLGMDTGSVQKNRVSAVFRLAQIYRSCVVLKGAGTLIQDGDLLSVCSAGNPGMAVAGMGDVLSGVIGALIAQGLPAADAARLGVWLHARGADILVAQQGEIGLLATEIIPSIRQQLNELVSV